MSDLQTEMKRVLNHWEGNAMTTQEQHKVTLGEKIFNWVKAHPYSGVDEVERGIGVGKEASVSSYLRALMNKGIVNREEKLRMPYPGTGSRYYFVYYHTSETYNVARKPRAKVTRKAKTFKQPHMTAEKIVTHINDPIKDLQDLKITKKAFIAEDFIEGLTVTQAKSVYLALAKIFS